MLINDLVITGTSGKRVDLPTHRAYGLVVNNTKHGFGSIQFKMRLSFSQFALLYGNPQALDVQLKRGKMIFNGRLEDIDVNVNVVTFTALGYWRALSDVKYNALWSASGYNDWYPLSVDYNTAVLANRVPTKYNIDFNNHLQISLTKNTIYNAAAEIGSVSFRIPSGSNRLLLGLMATFEIFLPNNWIWQIVSWDYNYTAPSAALVQQFISAGVLTKISMALYFPLQTNATLSIEIFNNTGANYNMAGETGAFYMKCTDLRLVTTDSLRWLNTSLTVARAAGTGTATVGSTASMYIGQKVVIDSGLGNLSEIVTVLTIPSGTTFTATFVNNHIIGAQVSAVTLYPDQIVSDVLATARAFNTSQLSSLTSLIQTSGFDLLNEIYEDTDPTEIIDYLCGIGDGTQRYEAGILENKQLYFRPRGNVARQWYIDYNDPKIKTSLDQLYNNIYVVYQDLQRNDLRSAATTDSASISKYGIQRQEAINLNTTNPTLANTKRDLTLTNLKTIVPQTSITVRSILATPSTVGSIIEVRPNDIITVLNLPAVIQGTALDRLRTFRVVETKLDYDKHQLDIIPELTLPAVDYQLANLLLFASRVPDQKTGLGKQLDRRQT